MIYPAIGFDPRILRQFELMRNAGSAGVEQVNSGIVPADQLWYVALCSVNHDDPTARTHTILIRRTDGSNPVSFAISYLPRDTISQVGGVSVCVTRSFILPPLHRVEALVNGIGVGFIPVLYLAVLRLRLPGPERTLDAVWSLPRVD